MFNKVKSVVKPSNWIHLVLKVKVSSISVIRLSIYCLSWHISVHALKWVLVMIWKQPGLTFIPTNYRLLAMRFCNNAKSNLFISWKKFSLYTMEYIHDHITAAKLKQLLQFITERQHSQLPLKDICYKPTPPVSCLSNEPSHIQCTGTLFLVPRESAYRRYDCMKKKKPHLSW